MRLQTKLSIAAAAWGLAAFPAQAAVQVTAYEYAPPSLGGGVSLASANFAAYVPAGRILSTIQDLTTLSSRQEYTFCIDVLTGYYTYSPFNDVAMTSVFSNAGQQNALAGLLAYANIVIDGAGSMSDKSLSAAAFALAIWEVVYETGGSYNLTSGNFSVYGDFGAAGALANTYLGNVTNGSWAGSTGNVRVLASSSRQIENQNQIYLRPMAPVPEPSTWAMMLAGFAMIGGAMRRRFRPVLRVA